MKERPSDRAIARVLAGRAREFPGTCPDDDILAAYLEFRLGSTERQRLEAHAANCSLCQEILGLAMRLQTERGVETVDPEGAHGRRVLFRLSMPVSVVALIVVGVTLAALMPRMLRKAGVPAEVTRIAETRPGLAVPTGPAVAVPGSKAPPMPADKPKPAPTEASPRATVPKPSGIAATPTGMHSTAQPAALSEQTETALTTAPAGTISADRSTGMLSAQDGLVKGAEPVPKPQEARSALMEPAVPVKAELRTAEKSQGSVRETVAADADRQAGVAYRQAAGAPNPALQVAASKEETGRLVKAGDKSFRIMGDSIVDLEALSHPEAPRVEIKADSNEYLEISGGMKGLDALWHAGQTLTLYSQGKIYVVRR